MPLEQMNKPDSRMWWVRVDEDGPELAMSWNLVGISDLACSDN